MMIQFHIQCSHQISVHVMEKMEKQRSIRNTNMSPIDLMNCYYNVIEIKSYKFHKYDYARTHKLTHD